MEAAEGAPRGALGKLIISLFQCAGDVNTLGTRARHGVGMATPGGDNLQDPNAEYAGIAPSRGGLVTA
jgi:hypothetical protein